MPVIKDLPVKTASELFLDAQHPRNNRTETGENKLSSGTTPERRSLSRRASHPSMKRAILNAVAAREDTCTLHSRIAFPSPPSPIAWFKNTRPFRLDAPGHVLRQETKSNAEKEEEQVHQLELYMHYESTIEKRSITIDGAMKQGIR
jgi:hypothetical protein